jgi:carboxypeptidase Taq
MEGKLDIADVPKAWAKKYKSYLGVTPTNDTLGCLQDVHWTSGFGYFPTYALGNFYNSMYYNKMKEEIDVADAIRTGHMDTINKWMFENVWKDADKLDSSDWIKQITARELTSKDFLEYIENKYGMLYGL